MQVACVTLAMTLIELVVLFYFVWNMEFFFFPSQAEGNILSRVPGGPLFLQLQPTR